MRIAVLGDIGENNVLERLGFQIRSNACPQDGEPVLIAISVQGWPVGLVEALNRAADAYTNYVGILMTDVGRGEDDELAELAELEARYVLDALEVFPSGFAHRLCCFRTDDSELRARLLTWVTNPPDPTVFRRAEPLD